MTYFLNVNISETVNGSEKMHRTTFICLDMCQWMIPLWFTPNNLNSLLQGKKYEILISKKQWETPQACELTLSTWRFSNILIFSNANDL